MPQQITLFAHEFWNYVKSDADCDEILKLLEGRNELISHFLYFSSLGHTLDDLNELVKKKKKEVGHVFTELTQSPVFRQRTEPFVRRKHRLHPYRRPIVIEKTDSSGSTHNPIDVDAIDNPPSSSSSSSSSSSDATSFVTAPINPPTRPTTPEPPFGTGHRVYHDDVHHFTLGDIYYVQCKLSGHVYLEEEFYELPRAPYQHALPQLRLPTLGRMRKRTSHHV
jgi:hypothetical protein